MNDPARSNHAHTSVVRISTSDDFADWIALARQVEPLFGPMVDDEGFCQGLRAALSAGDALCVRDASGRFCGGVVLERRDNAIAWLAVSADARGQGLGRRLVEAAVARLSPDTEIVVQTFAPGVAEGAPARRLYLELGFVDRKEGGLNPAGVPTVVMVRPVGVPQAR